MKKIKVGVFGAGRGVDIARNFMMLGCEIVALCDNHEERLKNGAKQLGIEDNKGSIERGKDADFLVFDADFTYPPLPAYRR